ncbi:MAG: glycosyltransferase family 4 protein [Herpetosiphon sp.]|nr:glycosyltransferase family 4 protein [Herpetosiphon sp.]
MKILIVGLGGVTATFRNWPERIVAVELAKRGHHVRAIGTHDPSRPALAARHEVVEGVTVQRVRSGYAPNRELAQALDAGDKPDIIHLMHPRNVLAAQTTNWARKHGIPTVYTWLGPYHDAYLVDDREHPFETTIHYDRPIWTRQQLIARWKTARSWRTIRDHLRNFRLHSPLMQANHLIPCSQFEADELKRMGLPQDSSVIPLWIDQEAIMQTPIVAPTFDLPRPWLLFVGQLTPRKGYDLALRALPHILKRYPTASLLMVSGINHAERTNVELIGTELGINEHIHFLGRLEDAELVNLFRACDVYLTPTRYEGFGLTLLEAMLAGAPLVASDIPVVNEIVRHGENGLLARYNDAEAFAAAAMQILDQPELAQTLKIGGQSTCQLWYNPTRLTSELERVYEKIKNQKSKIKTGVEG